MRQITQLLIAAFALTISACSGGSSLPNATGKGSIRAIHAIETAPEVAFLIEERTIDLVDFRQITSLASYDDLEYDFNFDVLILGDTQLTRFATQHLEVIAGMDYIMLLTGTIANASITIWESPERNFDGTETVFEAGFAHTAESLGAVDYYFAAPGVVPMLGEAIGTLNFGEILPALDYAAGDFVLTVTGSGNPADVLFESTSSAYSDATQYTISVFDGGANTLAPVIGRAFSIGAGALTSTTTLPDINYPATVELINGSLALGTIDVYDDDMQSSKVAEDLAHTEVSAEINLAVGDNTFYFTPSNMNAPILIEETINFLTGLRARIVGFGTVDTLRAISYLPDRRPVETQAKLQLFNSAGNFDFISVFVVDADEVLDTQAAILPALTSGTLSTTVPLPAGSFDIYLQEPGSTEIIAGPIRLDVALGDVVGAVIFDTVDPAIVDLQFLPNNP